MRVFNCLKRNGLEFATLLVAFELNLGRLMLEDKSKKLRQGHLSIIF